LGIGGALGCSSRSKSFARRRRDTTSTVSVTTLLAQKHTEWQAGDTDRGPSCLDFVQQLGYREYSRWGSLRSGNAHGRGGGVRHLAHTQGGAVIGAVLCCGASAQ
jgi:hypothetical protein